jgi:hypothetical protein
MTPTPSQEPAASNPQILKAYKLGFLRAAEWVNRDDLRADLDSGAYAKDRARDLGPMLLQAAPVAAEPSDAEIVLSALTSGEWGLVRNLPNDCFTDNANLRHAWSVRRLVPPYCADRHDSERQWSGPTARRALQTASDDLDVPLPAALAVSPAPQAAPVAAKDKP